MDVRCIRNFTQHALARLKERNITEEMAKYICEKGAISRGHDSCFIIQGKLPEKQKVELRLVLNELGDLVTACWRRTKKANSTMAFDMAA